MLEDMSLAEMEEAARKYGTLTQAAQALGISHQRFLRRYHKLRGAPSPTRDHEPAGPAGVTGAPGDIGRPGTPGRSLQEFQQSFDKSVIVPAKIREGLTKLGNGWEYELGFAKLANVSLPDLYAVRAQFEDYIVLIRKDGKRAWAGTPKIAAQMREMLR